MSPLSPTGTSYKPAQAPLPAQKFSLSLGSKKSSAVLAPPSKKRPRSALEDDAADDDTQTQQEISTFGVSAEPVKKVERVIQSIPNADWQDPTRRRKQKSRLPGENSGESRAGAEWPDQITVQEPEFGLNVVHRNGTGTPPAEDDAGDEPAPKQQTADEEALEALTVGRRYETKTINPSSEDDAFRDSYDEAPDAPTFHDFAAQPVEGFGAALLRGYVPKGKTLESYGYNEDGKDDEPKRRPGLLGLGAKESGLGVELGAWGRGAKTQKGEGYVPLGRKNIKTGEIVTDEELKAKLEKQKEDEKNQKYVSGKIDGNERKQDEKPRELERKRIEYRESKSSRNHEGDDEYESRRERRRKAEHEDDETERHGRHERDHERRRRSKDRGYDKADDRDRRRHVDHHGRSEAERDRHRRRDRDDHRSSRR